jgi:hypothetical protein
MALAYPLVPGPPPGFPLLSPHLKESTTGPRRAPFPFPRFLLNLALSHPEESESSHLSHFHVYIFTIISLVIPILVPWTRIYIYISILPHRPS